MSLVRLYTIQSADHWRRCRAQGRLVATPSTDPSFASAYEWMREQMSTRLSAHSGQFPIWAWTTEPASLHGYGAPGSETVLLEADVPADRVLRSSFIAWHAVLARAYLALSEHEADIVEAFGPTRADIQRSWTRIFDFDCLTEWAVGSERREQACVDGIDVREVRAETFFVQHAWVPED